MHCLIGAICENEERIFQNELDECEFLVGKSFVDGVQQADEGAGRGLPDFPQK